MGLTDLGFERDTLEDLEQEAKDNFVATFEDAANNIVPSVLDDSFFGLLSNLIARIRQLNQQSIEDVYYSFFLSTSSGVSLDRVVDPTERRDETKSTVPLKWTGTVGATVLVGSLAETAEKIQFITKETGVLVDIGGGVGQIEVAAEAVIEGPTGNVADGAITFIPVPITGVDSVTNDTQSLGGLAVESDTGLRTKAIEERSVGKTSSLIAVENAVAAVDNVSSVFGAENVGLTTDGDGRPPGSFEITARGGTDQDIAEAILDIKSAGVETFGSEAVIVTDSSGRNVTINFSRPTTIEVWVRVELNVTAAYDNSQDNIIKQRILDYIGGVNPDTVESQGLNIGTDVLSYKTSGVLYETNANEELENIREADTFLGTTVGSQVDAIIVIDNDEEAVTDFDKIIINKTVV